MILKQKPAHKILFALSLMLLLIFPMVNCNQQQGGDSSSDFAIQPGDVTAISPTINDYSTSFDVSFGGTPYSGNYTIIYEGTVNGVNYVGISAGTDPGDNLNSFKLFIYLQDSAITGADKDLSTNGMIKVIENGTSYETSNPSITIDISDNGDGTFTIHSDNSPVTVGGTSLSFNSDIVALEVGN